MKIKNIKDLREEATEIFNDLRKDALEVKKAKELNSTLGVIINSVKVELTYAKDRKVEPQIEFLNQV